MNNKRIQVIIPFFNSSYIFRNYIYESILNSKNEITKFNILFFNKNYLIEWQLPKLREYNIDYSFADSFNIPLALFNYISRLNSELVVLADPNLLFLPDWDVMILNLLENKNKSSSITGKILEENNLIFEAGFSFKENEQIIQYGFLENQDNPKYNYVTKIDFGSQYLICLYRELLLKFFETYLYQDINFNELLLEISNYLNKNNFEIWYQPASNFVYNQSKFSLDSEKNDNFEIKYIDNYLSKFLILILHSNHELNNLDYITSRIENLKFKTQKKIIDLENLDKANFKAELLEFIDDDVDYLILIKDSIMFSENYLNIFIELIFKLNFDIALPARTTNSFISNPLLQKANGIIARKINFFSTNPFLVIRKKFFLDLLENDFNDILSYEEKFYFPEIFKNERPKIGIIDALPIHYEGHEIIKDISYKTKVSQTSISNINVNFLTTEVYSKVI
ncbi:MAG: hypothetical protein NZM09_11050 [Ignavibacterium sp.]|nr:hypothetical protein [Ignavibacterium sp.]MDW8376214.1 hypothetical protein [Ignavibacteriales bacterium]